MLQNPEAFIDQYIHKTVPGPTGEALDIGNYYHAHFLEPHALNEYAVFKGKQRRGIEWINFKAENEGKTILTLKGLAEANICIKATQASPYAMDTLKGAMYEVSLYDILEGLPCKVRFDILFLSQKLSYIADLKSTRGDVKDPKKIKKTIRERDYDLSAAQYVDMMNNYLTRKNLLTKYAPITQFRWPFASKDQKICREYVADKAMLELGRYKYKRAIALIKKHRANNWTIKEERTSIGPEGWELQAWKPEVKKEKKK